VHSFADCFWNVLNNPQNNLHLRVVCEHSAEQSAKSGKSAEQSAKHSAESSTKRTGWLTKKSTFWQFHIQISSMQSHFQQYPRKLQEREGMLHWWWEVGEGRVLC
jgi:hypothetical protein